MKTLVLGFGAQKAGTTWLYNLLSSSEHFVPGLAKEYHVLERIHVPFFRGDRRGLIGSLFKPGRLCLRSMERDLERYFDHFAGLLSSGDAIAADLSPDNGALSAPFVGRLCESMSDRGVDVRALFIMRDPVDRCTSAFHMNRARARGLKTKNAVKGWGSADEAFRRFVDSEYAGLRTRYAPTIETIQSVFDPADRLFLFYETLFKSETVERLEDFLGCSFDHGLVHEKVNPYGVDFRSNAGEALSDEVLDYCRDVFFDTYRDVARVFPEARELWTFPTSRSLH